MVNENPVIDALIQHYDSLLKITVMMVNSLEAAQDIIQNLAATLFSKQNKLKDINNIPAYLSVCLRRATLNHLRDSARTVATDPNQLAKMRSDPSYKAVLDNIEWEQVLRSHLKGYSDELIQAFIDHYMKDHPIEQLSFKLGITPNTLSQQFRRMRNKIASSSPQMALYMFLLTMRMVE